MGDVFYYEGGAEKPEGLWPLGLDRHIPGPSLPVSNRALSPTTWYSHEDRRVVCCTDGVRPVVYELVLTDIPIAE